MPRNTACALVALALLALCEDLAAASPADDAEPIRLAYRAADGCPTIADFVSRVRARTPRVRPAWPGETARSFDLVLEAGPPARGELTIRDVDQPPGSRRVSAATCAEAADALSFVVALAIDPRLAAQPVPEVPGTAAILPLSAPAVPALRAPVSPTLASPVPASPAPVVAPQGDAQERLPARAAPADDASAARSFSLGANVTMTTGVAPDALFAVSPYLGWRAAGSLWEPSLRLSFTRADEMTPTVPGGGRGAFVWTVGQLDACAFSWPGPVLQASACARVEAGLLEVSGVDVAAPQTKLQPWFAAGPVVRAEWSPGSSLFVDAEVGLSFRVTNDHIYFQPNATIYDVPIIGANAGVGLGVRFL